KHAQEIYMEAFNSAMEQYGDEAKAAQVAITAVKNKYKKVGDEWVLKEEFMENLIEHFDNPLSEAVVDRELSIIRNVCMLTPVSKNNWHYTEQAMRSGLYLFEGAKAFANHPRKDEKGEVRDVRDLIGKHQNIRMEGGKVKGDLMVLKSHAPWVFDLAEQMPELVGLSLRGNGKIRKDKSGEVTVEEITSVNSVDLVTEPASTSSLFEQFNNKEDDMDFAKLTLEELSEKRPDLVTAISESTLKKAKGMEDTKKLQAKVEKLEEEIKKKDLELDEFRVQQNLEEKRKQIDKLLKGSKLHREAPQAITPTFRRMLESVEEQKEGDKTITVEEQIKVLIADREEAAFKGTGKVRNMGGEKDDDEKKELTDEQLAESVKKGRQLGKQTI
ncbi:MAG: ChaB family protein, partial [Desulfobacterales bacterium]|nr:ChaB family protein [Desulfobacterales bacterium]